MELENGRLIWLGEILETISGVNYSMLDAAGELLWSNLPHAEVFRLFSALEEQGGEILTPEETLSADERTRELFARLEAATAEELDAAVKFRVFTIPFGMSWISILETWQGEACRVHVLGPVFLDRQSLRDVRKQLDRLSLTVPMRRHFLSVMESYPVISLSRFYEYGMMLYCAITRKSIRVDEFGFTSVGQEGGDVPPEEKAYAVSYETEQKILSLVEAGNVKWREEMAKITAGEEKAPESLRYFRLAKDRVIVLAALCAQRAEEAGVIPETALVLRERYVTEVESARDLEELNAVNGRMLQEFVESVRRRKAGRGMSPQIMDICDYIDLHLGEKLTADVLARKLGYHRYYFTARFMEETGESLREYIRNRRIARACGLLRGTALDIEQIAGELGFGSRSYFGEVFKARMGVTPGEYRRGREGG